eukprot:11814654-Karenia_brevis.AAC.1
MADIIGSCADANVDMHACQTSGVDVEPVGSFCTDVHSKHYLQCDRLPQTAHHALFEALNDSGADDTETD